MDFTKENVKRQWSVLNTCSSVEDKKKADEYLVAFKVTL